MKKLFLTVIVLFSTVVIVNAQDVGQVWVGGSVGVSATNIEGDDNYLTFRIIPEFGYVINDRVGIGLKLGYQQTDLDLFAVLANENYTPGKARGILINPFLRYSVYKGTLGGVFVDGGIGYANDFDTKVHAIEAGFRPGVAHRVSEKIALTAKFGFLGYGYIEGGDTKIHGYGFNLNLDQALFGINFVF
jgi:hypothetical protein